MTQQYPDRWKLLRNSGKTFVKVGVVSCLAAFVFGLVCMTIVAVAGQGEDPPKIFQQMGAGSCVLFALGAVVGLIGWVMNLSADPGTANPPKPAKRVVTSLQSESPDSDSDAVAEPEDETKPVPDAGESANAKPKSDPYASDHRRREF